MQIYINKNNQQLGPFEESIVLEMIRSGQLSPDDRGFRQGDGHWQTLKVLFPNAFPVWTPPPTPVNYQPSPISPQSVPRQGGGSKGLLFGLLGLIVVAVLAVVGLAGFLIYIQKGKTVANVNSNKPANSNTNSANKTTPKTNPNPGEPRFNVMKNKSEELAQMSPPLKLDPNAKIKGKVAVVIKDGYGAEMKGFNAYYNDYSLSSDEVYGIAKRRLAVTPEEVDTLIQVLCNKGKYVGNYEGGIKGYTNVCKVSLIDYRNPAVIAQETFTNDRPEKSISKVYEKGGEYTFPNPRELIGEFITKFPLEKLANPTTDIPFDDDGGKYGKYEPFKDIASELARVSMPVNLNPNPTIKGKVAIAEQQPEGEVELKGFDVYGKEFYKLDIENFGLTTDKMAENEDEIETVIRINCKKGNKIKTVSRTAVYSSQCEVSIIDYKSATIIAQKSFENKQIVSEIDTDVYKIQYIALPANSEIEAFVKGIPKS